MRRGPGRSILLAVVLASLVAPVGGTTRLEGPRLVSGGNAVTDWATIAVDSIVVVAKKFPGIALVYMALAQRGRVRRGDRRRGRVFALRHPHRGTVALVSAASARIR